MWEKAGAQGLLGIDTPAEQGGIGADILYSAITWEEQYVFAKILSLFVFSIILDSFRVIFTARKVIFSKASVILFTGGGLPQCMLGYHPPGPGRHTPPRDQAGTPPCPDQAGTPPDQAGTSPHTLPDQAPPWDQAGSPHEQSILGDTIQRTGGMHPTGVQSCCIGISICLLESKATSIFLHLYSYMIL